MDPRSPRNHLQSTRLVTLPHLSQGNSNEKAQPRDGQSGNPGNLQPVYKTSATTGQGPGSALESVREGAASPRYFFSTAFIDDSGDEGTSELGEAPKDNEARQPRGPLGTLRVTYDSTRGQRQVNIDPHKRVSTSEDPFLPLYSVKNYVEVGLPEPLSGGPLMHREVALKQASFEGQQHGAAPGVADGEEKEAVPCCAMKLPGAVLIRSPASSTLRPNGRDENAPTAGLPQHLLSPNTGVGVPACHRDTQHPHRQEPVKLLEGRAARTMGYPSPSLLQGRCPPAQFPLRPDDTSSSRSSFEVTPVPPKDTKDPPTAVIPTPSAVSALHPQDNPSHPLYRASSVSASASVGAAAAEGGGLRRPSSCLFPPWFHSQQQEQPPQAGFAFGAPYPALAPVWAPGFPLAQPYWMARFPQGQGLPSPFFYPGNPFTRSFGIGHTGSQQVLYRQPSAVSLESYQGGNARGPRRSSTSSSDQRCMGHQARETPRDLGSREPQQQLLVQHQQHMQQQQRQQQQPQPEQDLLNKCEMYGQPEGPQATDADTQAACRQCSWTSTRLQSSLSAGRYSSSSMCNNCPYQGRPLPPPACCTAEGALPCVTASHQPRMTPCQTSLSASHPTAARPSPCKAEAPGGSTREDRMPPHSAAADPISGVSSVPTGDPASSAKASDFAAPAATGCCNSAAAAESCGISGSASIPRPGRRRSVAESPAAIGGRILRRLQTLEGILKERAQAERTPTDAAEEPCGKPLCPCDLCDSGNANESINESARSSARAPPKEEADLLPKPSQGNPADIASESSAPGGPANPSGHTLPSAAALPLGGALGTNEGGLSLIAAGVPRLTLAALNTAGGPGGAGPASLPPRRAPASVFLAPKWPSSPEPCRPLAEWPLRGHSGRGRTRDDTSREKNKREMTEKNDAPSTENLPAAEGDHSNALKDTPANECKAPGKRRPDTNGQGEDRDSLASQSTSGTSERVDAEKAPSQGGPSACASVQRSGHPSPKLPSLENPPQEPLGRRRGTSAEAKGPARGNGETPAEGVPTNLCTPVNLQRLHVRWALWSEPPLSLRGTLETGATSTDGRHGGAKEDTEQDRVCGFPSLDAGLSGCKTCGVDFYLPAFQLQAASSVGSNEWRYRGFAIFNSPGVRLLVLWDGPRRPHGAFNPHSQTAVWLLAELRARRDPQRAVVAAFNRVLKSLPEAERRETSAVAALILGDETSPEDAQGTDEDHLLSAESLQRPLRVYVKELGSAEALIACKTSKDPACTVLEDAVRDVRVAEIKVSDPATVCLGNASFWNINGKDRVVKQLCAEADIEPQFLQNFIAMKPCLHPNQAAVAMRL